MNTTEAFAGLRCTDCGTTHDPVAAGRCSECDGLLDAVYDHDSAAELSGHGLGRYAPLLPFVNEALVSLGTGGTPLVAVPELADELGVAATYVKDEGRNPTGAFADRGVALAVTAASEAGADDIALPTTGNAGQAAAAHAARAGLASHSFVPSRTPFVNKAMINVHGGDMSVVEGRYPEARESFADHDEGWASLAPFENPYRHEGAKTLAYELAEAVTLDGAPDAVVHPTAHGTGIVGLHKGFRDLRKRNRVDAAPRLHAVQPEGCSPVVDAVEREAETVSAVEHPDTICGPLEVPEPAGGRQVIEALRANDRGAVAVSDDALLEGATGLAAGGLTMGATGGAAVAGARQLADRGAFDPDDVVVLVNPTTGNKEEDILRSHLMKQGI
ncbi:MAG: threonine synthase [Natronomonas sp.]|jgi:threonine synthase